jgi:capsular polysaccharide biosynthesis protein
MKTNQLVTLLAGIAVALAIVFLLQGCKESWSKESQIRSAAITRHRDDRSLLQQ